LVHGRERRLRGFGAARAQTLDDVLKLISAIAGIDPFPFFGQSRGGGSGGQSFEADADIVMAVAIGEHGRQFRQAICGQVNIGELAIKRIGAAEALAGQSEIGADKAGSTRQQEGGAHIRKETDADLRHRDA